MKKLLLIILSAVAVGACNPKVASIVSVSGPDCRVVRCRTDLPPILVQLVDASGRPVTLDSYETLLAGTKTPVPREDAEPNPKEGYYPVVPNTWALTHQNTRSRMVFIGRKGNQEVVRETFEIHADCCKITRSAGPERITIR